MILACAALLWAAPSPGGRELEKLAPLLRPAGGIGRRGGIYDRTGEPLAVSWEEPAGGARRYSVPEGLAPVLGYVHPRLGLAGLERSLDGVLRGDRRGRDVVLTISRELQEAVEDWFGGRAGAAVVLTVPEGEILALVSLPGFDPGDLDGSWPELRADPDHPLFPRATQGLYPPGSAFKVVVMAAALEAGMEPGPGGWGLPAPSRLQEALAASNNEVFGRLGLKLGPVLPEVARRLGLGGAPTLEVPAAAGRVPEGPLDRATAGLLGIGQGPLAVTPLQMAILAAVVATGGRSVTPRLVRWIEGASQPPPAREQRLLDARVAQAVADGMRRVVEEGTGRAARGSPAVAGKTGTAEVAGGAPHAWFIGFAPADRPRVAAAVVVEHGGSGGQVAAPIAARILRAADAMMGGGG